MSAIEHEIKETESKLNKSDQKIGTTSLDNIIVKKEETIEENIIGPNINEIHDKEENFPQVPEFTLEVIKEGSAIRDNGEYDSKEPEELSYSIRLRIFFFFLLANIFLNYDTGVIPASLLELIKEVQLDYKEQALIGSLVYLGLSFASLFVAPLFQKYGAAKVCSVAMLLNTLCCFVFSISKLKYVLFGTRFMMGVCEAFIVIYGPVWVNNYSPPENSARWMGILHSCTALGVMIGYLFAGIVINFFSSYLSWRFAIQVQGIAQIPIALYFYLENESYINVDTSGEKNDGNVLDDTFMSNSIHLSNIPQEIRLNHLNTIPPITPKKRNRSSFTNRYGSNPRSDQREEVIEDSRNRKLNQQISKSSLKGRKQFDKRIDTIETSNLSRYCSQACVVLGNPLYISVTLGLCSMYFIVTGIQFWMTSYLIDILGNNPIEVVIIFSAVSITAPLAGVIVGGTFADKYGGYKGKNTLKALKLCLAFGVVAFVFSFPIGFLYGLVYIIVLLWTFLFFGAAIVPVGTGIMVSSVRKDCQATSSSISQLIFNFLGYFMSPILTGVIMDSFDNKYEGYKWGMRLIFWWAIFGVIFMGSAWIFAYRKYRNRNKDDIDLIEDEMNQNINDLMKMEIMRRIALNVA